PERGLWAALVRLGGDRWRLDGGVGEAGGEGLGGVAVEDEDAFFGLALLVEVAAGRHPGVVDAEQVRRERPVQVVGPGERTFDPPVVGGDEGHPLPFALHDDTDGHALLTACGETGLYIPT